MFCNFIGSFPICFGCNYGLTIMHVTTEYFDYEQGITREYTTETNFVESGDNGIMFYKSQWQY